MRIVCIALILIPAVNLFGMGNTDNDILLISGKVSVIGNEPNTEIAIRTENGGIFVLTDADELWHHQGKYVTVKLVEIEKKSIYPSAEYAQLIEVIDAGSPKYFPETKKLTDD